MATPEGDEKPEDYPELAERNRFAEGWSLWLSMTWRDRISGTAWMLIDVLTHYVALIAVVLVLYWFLADWFAVLPTWAGAFAMFMMYVVAGALVVRATRWQRERHRRRIAVQGLQPREMARNQRTATICAQRHVQGKRHWRYSCSLCRALVDIERGTR